MNRDMTAISAINELVLRFARAVELRDWATVRFCLANEVEIDFSEHLNQPAVRFKAEGLVRSLRQIYDQPGLTIQHTISNQSVSTHQDKAICISYYVLQHSIANRLPEQSAFTLYGWYVDTLIQGDGGEWKIQKRKMVIRWASGDTRLLKYPGQINNGLPWRSLCASLQQRAMDLPASSQEFI